MKYKLSSNGYSEILTYLQNEINNKKIKIMYIYVITQGNCNLVQQYDTYTLHKKGK